MLIVPEQEVFLVAPGGYNSHSRPKPFTEEKQFFGFFSLENDFKTNNFFSKFEKKKVFSKSNSENSERMQNSILIII